MKPLPSLAAGTAVGLIAAALASCSLAPHYSTPATENSGSFKEAASPPAGEVGSWTAAAPADGAARGAWWAVFGDANLNQLEDKAYAANQTLAGATARYREARAAADAADAQLFPIVNLAASGQRQRISQYAPTNITGHPVLSNDFILRAQTSYELDFWGRLRNTAAAARGRADASAADLGTALLSIQAELAADYIELRGLDAQIQLLASTVEDYRAALRITQDRYNGGAAALVDVEQAITQLETAQVQLADTQLSRAQLEHAIAILVGALPASFSLVADPLHMMPPAVNPGLPSHLLERRPDVASAERQMFAANADVGVARAAWFPTFVLNAGIGYEADHASDWIQAPSQIWSIGPSMLFTLLDWGARSAQNRQAKAVYDETVANYRGAVLTAFGQVEDQLAAIRWLDTELDSQGRAVESSQRALDQSNFRYRGGIATYLEVVTAQNAALQARQEDLNLRVRRLNAALELIKALGGGWTADELKNPPMPAKQEAAAQAAAGTAP